uniref:J domain-containing protein n=1 Tax=Cannabis sativa TaxID=3483 RepID=A0A803PJA8_CANSA
MAMPRWRNVLLLKNSLISSSSPSSTITYRASFHSTPVSCEKWKNKWNSHDVEGGQQPSKNYIRYATRQKRADAKKALKDLLNKSGASKFSFQDDDPMWRPGAQVDKSDNSRKKHKPKYSAKHSYKAQQKKTKGKYRGEGFHENFNEHETVFRATFGNRWYTWSFNLRNESFFRDSASEFEWQERSNGNYRSKTFGGSSDSESDEESFTVGSSSDRTVLGLPLTGPLKLEDVKKAFRLSALKWHPDKHQGPSQAMAEEKFKHCADAYKSLCKVLSPA